MARNPEGRSFIDHLDPLKDEGLMKTLGFFAILGVVGFAAYHTFGPGA